MNALLTPRPLIIVVITVILVASCVHENSQPGASKTAAPPIGTLSGATLYAINCSRCHQERYPTEFTPNQWNTIMIHMRVRANLPADQAREILKYLQENAGN